MYIFDELLWTLNSKGFCVLSSHKDDGYIKLRVPFKFEDGFEKILSRLNIIYDNVFKLNYCFSNEKCTSIDGADVELRFNKDIQAIETEITDLNKAIIMDEYVTYQECKCGKIFDIKLGVSCNNNCIHCVVKPNVLSIQNQYPDSVIMDSGVGMQCSRDLSFNEVVDLIPSTRDISTIVLTGGEPTIRKDFVKILKWIYYNRPETNIYIQTNGRNLSDINLVKSIARYTRQPGIAIAVHGLETTHNQIVNNRRETGNPYKETVSGIENCIKIFSESLDKVRTETVLTNYNIDDITGMVRSLYNLGIRKIGISYPHLCGFTETDVKTLVPSYEKIINLLRELNEFVADNSDCAIGFEEIPPCFFNKLNAQVKLASFTWKKKSRDSVSINFIGEEVNDFGDAWEKEHSKFEKCQNCVLDDQCLGFWNESGHLFNENINPIQTVEDNLQEFLDKTF